MSNVTPIKKEFDFDDLEQMTELAIPLFGYDGQPSNLQLWQRMEEMQNNHTVVLKNLRTVHEEHIRKVVELDNKIAETNRRMKDVERSIQSERFASMIDDTLGFMKLNREVAKELNIKLKDIK